jgi:hypothetical protein
MRKIFQTQRLETVEGVAQLLNSHGIQTKITNGRSYKGNHRHDFSYVHPERAPMPAVWVIRADDQPHARKLLREAGLMDSERSFSSYLPEPNQDPIIATGGERPGGKWALRIRIILLAAIAAMAAVMMLGMFG